MNRIKNFFKLIFFEIKKIYRSKFVFYFLVFAPLIISFSIAFIVQSFSDSASVKNVIFVSENETQSETSITLIENIFDTELDIEWQNNLEDAIYQLKLSNVILVVYDNQTTNEMVVFYDISSDVSLQTKNSILQKGYKFAYVSIKDELSEWGITLDEFAVNPTPVVDKTSPMLMRLEAVSIALILGFFLTVGISYTMSRDNETGIIKQLSYTPMKTTKYISIRTTFFAILTLVQSLVILGVFAIMGVNYGTTLLPLIGLCFLFCMAYMGLCLIFATTKNQLSTISLAIVFILIPAVIAMMGSGMNVAIQSFLYISPLTAFVQLFKTYFHYEIINVIPLIILICEAVIYYLIAMWIMKLKTNRNI